MGKTLTRHFGLVRTVPGMLLSLLVVFWGFSSHGLAQERQDEQVKNSGGGKSSRLKSYLRGYEMYQNVVNAIDRVQPQVQVDYLSIEFNPEINKNSKSRIKFSVPSEEEAVRVIQAIKKHADLFRVSFALDRQDDGRFLVNLDLKLRELLLQKWSSRNKQALRNWQRGEESRKHSMDVHTSVREVLSHLGANAPKIDRFRERAAKSFGKGVVEQEYHVEFQRTNLRELVTFVSQLELEQPHINFKSIKFNRRSSKKDVEEDSWVSSLKLATYSGRRE